MEDQQNYQPQGQQTPTMPEPKSETSSKKNLLVMIALIFIAVVVAVGGTWYYMDSRQAKAQTNNQQQVAKLQSNITELTKKISAATTTPTVTPTPAAAQNELDGLNSYCATSIAADNNMTVEYTVYYQSKNGKFGECALVGKTGGGGMTIVKYTNNNWAKIWAGNGTVDQSYCTKFGIPYKIASECTKNF